MKTIAASYLTAILGLALVGVTNAGTMGPAKHGNWSGFYFGANVGYAWSNNNTDIFPLPTPALFQVDTARLASNMSGAVAGGQIGYNLQLPSLPSWILGLETDLDWSSFSAGRTVSAFGIGPQTGLVFTNAFTTHEKIKWIGTVRPRLGFLLSDNIMLFGTGGLAYGSIDNFANSNYTLVTYPAAFNSTKTGWTAGGGLEAKFAPNWSGKVEYLYTDLGNVTVIANPTLANPPFQTQYRWNNVMQMVRFGVNYFCNL